MLNNLNPKVGKPFGNSKAMSNKKLTPSEFATTTIENLSYKQDFRLNPKGMLYTKTSKRGLTFFYYPSCYLGNSGYKMSTTNENLRVFLVDTKGELIRKEVKYA